MKDETSNAEVIGLLRDIDGVNKLSLDILERIANTAEHRAFTRGEVLIKEGEAASTLFLVLRGRFTVMLGGRAIAEIAKGEPVGELAFFAGGTRTATVVAARDSAVLCLSRAAYDALAAHTPALANGVLAAVSRRLARTVATTPQLRPVSGQVCAMVPGGANAVIDPAFVAGLRAAFANVPGWKVLGANACDAQTLGDARALALWLEAQERAHGKLLLICEDPAAHPVWQKVAANNSDTIMIVAPKGGNFSAADAPSDLEKSIFAATLPIHLHVILHRPTSEDSTTNTCDWLAGRPVRLHHHLALDTPGDFKRIARFVRGEAIGLVLCGGGSYGTAHLAVIKALAEEGYVFDFVGGTSVGAAMAGALALGHGPDEVMDQCEDLFLRSKAMSRLTVPRFSLLDHRVRDAALRKHYADLNIEDLPINFFAIATSLTHNDVSVIRRGLLWQAICASTAIPGVFPPFLHENGEVLIDGGLIDNVPIDVMRDLNAGSNVVLNFLPGKPWMLDARYEDFPGRFKSLTGLVRKSREGVAKHPTAFTVLARAMVVNARKLVRQIDPGKDVLLNISVLPGMSFMDWKRGRTLFDITYEQISGMLRTAPAEADTFDAAMDRLRGVAMQLDASSKEQPEQSDPLQPHGRANADTTK